MKKKLVTNLVTPSAAWWDVTINGMRNAFKSWDKADSEICTNSEEEKEICYEGCPFVDHWEDDPAYPICSYDTYDNGPVFILGKNDRMLLMGLTSAGDPSHRKVLRQLPVIMDITAPLFFWKQLDTYKVGTTANSESTMHTITKYPFSQDDFYNDNFNKVKMSALDVLNCKAGGNIEEILRPILNEWTQELQLTSTEFSEMNLLLLNALREIYLDTKNMKYWYALNEALPQSYIQTRTWSANYEVLLTIIKNRLGHKIPIWDELITYWLKNVYLLLDLAVAARIVEVKDGMVCYQDEKHKDVYHELFKVD